MKKTAITPTRTENYPEWYQQVIQAADLAESSPTRGCMVIKPWGYAIWENIQQDLDRRFKETGHVNAYFPLLTPLSHFEKEAEHVEGFAKECAVVTHSRLKEVEGGLEPDGKLEEPLVVRPTSETMFGAMYSKWIQSYRDLPLLINQWANVMRWEMRTRLFLRTAEFLWQEGHTAHATKEEAISETKQMLDVYADFAESILAIPVVKGEKPCMERFPGAVSTYCIEAIMQDGKALQAGTSHFLGQNFAKASEIRFLSKEGTQEYAWTTSWGVSTRLIGGLIMTHSDDDGLVIPPKVAPQHIIILPIYRNNDERDKVLDYCKRLKEKLQKTQFNNQPIRVQIDDRDLRGGEKTWQWIKKGAPIRVEVGPRDIEKNSVFVGRRDKAPKDKLSYEFDNFTDKASAILEEIQNNLFKKAIDFRKNNSHKADSFDEFKAIFTRNNDKYPQIQGGFVECFAIDSTEIEEYIKPLKVTARCIILDQKETGKCIFTGKEGAVKMIFAKSY